MIGVLLGVHWEYLLEWYWEDEDEDDKQVATVSLPRGSLALGGYWSAWVLIREYRYISVARSCS